MLDKIIKEVYESMSDDAREVYNLYLERYKENNYNMISVIDKENGGAFVFSLLPIHLSIGADGYVETLEDVVLANKKLLVDTIGNL